MQDGSIVMFELCLDEDASVKIAEERHYRLVPSDKISAKELDQYRQKSLQ